ncbi:MAG: phosphodiester glycosidase family protein [Phaeodactylibacter sp.]|nr:phosphodiester glycosidase family protein [Phaeodactylibacter sp.]
MKRYIVWLSSITVLAIATLAVLQLQIRDLSAKLSTQSSETASMQRKLELLEIKDSLLLDSIRRLSARFRHELDSSLLAAEPEAGGEAPAQPAAYDAPPGRNASPAPAGSKSLAGSHIARKGVTLAGGASFDIFEVHPERADVAFYHRDGNRLIASIQRLKNLLQRQSRKLVFATNGGMFEKSLAPAGLYVEGGTEYYPLNLSAGGSEFTNFYSLPPNGVFFITKAQTAGIVKKENYLKASSGVAYATQSGPMVVISGRINPRFKKGSPSKFIRSGVGVRNDGSIVFAISRHPVNFYDFARIFMYYGCQDALYLDGGISEMYLPAIGRRQTANEFALLIAVTEKM